MNKIFNKIGNAGLIIFIFCISFSNQTVGQARDSLKNISVGFTPQYLAQDAFRIDLEKEFGAKRNRIALSPYLYNGFNYLYSRQRESFWGTGNNDPERIDQVNGWGLEAMYKYRISTEDKSGYPYIGFGAGFHNVRLQFKEFGWQPSLEDGLEVLRYALKEEEEKIQRFDALIVIGYRAFLGNHFAIDFAAGGISRTSWVETTQETARNQQQSILLYGYQGTILRLSVTLSVMLE